MAYRSDISWLTNYVTRWWRSTKRRKEAARTLHEIHLLRARVYQLAHEVNSWRWNVGGAAYEKKGTHFKDQAEIDLRNKIGMGFLQLDDEDFLG